MAFIVPDGISRGTHAMEPKLSHRFLFSIDSDPTTKLTCKSAQRPTQNSNVVQIPHLNKPRKTKGITQWDAINVTFLDHIAPSTTQYLWEWLMMHSDTYSGRDGYSAFYRREATLEMLGPGNDIVEKWEFHNVWMSSTSFGDTNWETDTPMEINVTLEFDDVFLRY